jgi:hypothetical protein
MESRKNKKTKSTSWQFFLEPATSNLQPATKVKKPLTVNRPFPLTNHH